MGKRNALTNVHTFSKFKFNWLFEPIKSRNMHTLVQTGYRTAWHPRRQQQWNDSERECEIDDGGGGGGCGGGSDGCFCHCCCIKCMQINSKCRNDYVLEPSRHSDMSNEIKTMNKFIFLTLFSSSLTCTIIHTYIERETHTYTYTRSHSHIVALSFCACFASSTLENVILCFVVLKYYCCCRCCC